ncbi:MAG TPA: YajQ family cyclic di-GMP-binding protein [Candidatus Saccharimonadales bacterium]|nr:YajQ family cyclic di-GMP-binding protein [Candidatus Saccharimonadales bacterium]
MAKDFTFDVVSEFDLSEVHNAIDQTKREIANRYDFKGSSASVEFDPKIGNGQVTITGDNQFHLDSIIDILRKRFAARDISQKTLDASREPVTSNLKMTWQVPLIKGLDQDKAKAITKLLRDRFPKVKTQIQGDAVRVSSTSKDDLQAVMQLLRTHDFDFPLNFTNYR